MDHVVYLDTKSKELENLLNGSKTMIIRGAGGRKMPYGRVQNDDVLYFIRNNGEGEIRAMGTVCAVINSEKLSVEESFRLIINNQGKLQLPDKQFEKIAGKRFLVLIGLTDVKPVESFLIDKSDFSNMDDWLPVGDIDRVRLNAVVNLTSPESIERVF
jgi:hypothetical protein